MLLASLFSRHAVLQRGQSNPVWGWDKPHHAVTLWVDGESGRLADVSTTADGDGAFRLACPELPPGGPYRLYVSGSTECVVDDVMVGEVWLASGQSNMEWKVIASAGASREIAEARWPDIRMFTVAHQSARTPKPTVGGDWRVATPDAVADFSAVGYAFARELHRRLGVPVGIIDASWGGTRVEAWTSVEALAGVMNVDAALALRARSESNAAQIIADYAVRLARWEAQNLPSDPGNEKEKEGWADCDFDDGDWRDIDAPGAWQARGMAHNGVVWFRKSFDLPPSFEGHELLLSLGAVDDFDHTYFNGTIVGSHPAGTPLAHQIQRRYAVGAGLAHPGKNVVAVRVFDQFGEGGLLGPAAELFIAKAASPESRLSLTGPWRCKVEHHLALVPRAVSRTRPPTPDVLAEHNAPGALFDGMIAPLVPYGLRGFISYQGESNVDAHCEYRARFVTLIRDWRSRWSRAKSPRPLHGDTAPTAEAFPFYFVQLPNFVETIDWPHLREAQAQALAEPSTGMAVTIDIGDPDDIHPRNKSEVGRRLALIALARTFGHVEIEWSGPWPDCVMIDGGEATIAFRHAEGLRGRGGEGVRGFALAGVDRVYHVAEARVEGRRVTVSSAAVAAPISVRYGWADNPDANLENAAGLPAAPFRTDAY